MPATWSATLRNDLRDLEAVQESLGGFLRAAGVAAADVSEVRLIAEEVLTNIIRHGCDDGREHSIEVAAWLRDGALTLRFRDDGRAFDPVTARTPDLDVPVEDRPVGGLGIHLVKELSERVEYARESRWNVLTVERSLAVAG